MEETHDENCDKTDMRRNALHETLNAIMIGVDGARTKGTNQTYMYKATWKKFLGWLADAVPSHDPMNPDTNTPKYIAAYIMLQCDDIVGLKDTAGSELSCRNLSYLVASLIRSAISYQYRQEGFSIWTAYGNKWIGNPALSTIVTDYLAGLRRKKARNGDVAASMRSLTCFDLECIYDLFFNPSRRTERMNLLVEGVTQERRQQLTDHLCAELYFGYVVSFLCLLRSDETLNIEIPHCRLQINRDGKWKCLKEIAALGNVQLESLKLRLELKLPFRKTAQEGGIQPFYLPIHHDKPHLCAVRAYLRWRLFLRERSSGKMF
ncbi:hypothetical protein BCR33DRAFT_681228 [Rhizoclosmatium globosum]|uniref:Uncharacterized protein n=1 Tax=Rhizoclosmatium globosum TaxID=329046 RepID=A0A1Y2C129_9FUNG|nr:hypothetical protein BCR33DRAFT_681228 [Rhizoclosmatium globosum]|eukprot:ORY40753.1 hypothetical protein BCR33DRAFT_681228 [Rhizoclosmatium globosum]